MLARQPQRVLAAATLVVAAAATATPRIPRDCIPPDAPPEVRQGIERLYTHDRARRAAAAKALGEMGPRAAWAAPFIATMIGTGEHQYGPIIAIAESRLGPAATEPTILTHRLGHHDARKRSAGVLANLRDARWVGEMFTCVAENTFGQYTRNAFAAMGQPALDYTIRALDDPRSEMRRRAVLCLPAFGGEQCVELACQRLTDDDHEIRRAAMEAVEQMVFARRGAVSVPAGPKLLAALRDDDPWIRRHALKVLATTTGAAKVEALVTASTDRDRTIRMAAVEALAGIGDERVVGALATVLGDADPALRVTAVQALGRSGRRAAVAPLARALREEKEAYIRERAVKALGSLAYPEVPEALRAAAGDADSIVRASALRAMTAVGDGTVVEPLAAALRDSVESVRIEAVRCLGLVGGPAAEGLLRRAAGEGAAAVRRAAADVLAARGDSRREESIVAAAWGKDIRTRAQALQRLAAYDGNPLAPLRAALNDADPAVRRAALGALRNRRDNACFPAIVAALNDADRDTVEAAADAIRPFGAEAVEPLLAALLRSDGRYRCRLVVSLTALNGERVGGALAAAVRARPEARRLPEVLTMLLRLGAEVDSSATRGELVAMGASAVASVVALLRHPWSDAAARAAAADVLGRIRDPQAAAGLQGALRDRDGLVRQRAVEALGHLKDPAAMRYLTGMLKDAAGQVRQAAARAVGELGTPAGLELLGEAWDSGDAYFRCAAAEGLGLSGLPAAVPRLLEALKDPHWSVRRAAAEALGRLGDQRAAAALTAALNDPHWYVRQAAAAATEALGKRPTTRPR